MSVNRFRVMLPLVAGVILSACPVVAQDDASPLDETVNILEQWVETERQISETASEWEANKASMENLLEIYKREIATLEEIIEDAEEDVSAAEIRRTQLTEEDRAVKDIEAKVLKALVDAEKNVKTLQAVLPPPLKEELTPVFNSLPENPEDSKLSIGQRVQPIVAILTQIQKFNQVVTVIEGFREFEAGRTVQTEMIYFGLGTAFYVDQANEHAGIGVLGAEGWSWQDNDDLIPVIRNFIEIYRGTQQASYVEVPISVN